MALRSKVICVKRLGWKRIAREFARLGWDIRDAEQEITTTYTHHYDLSSDGKELHVHTTQSDRVRVYISMVRDLNWYKAGHKIHVIDIFFSLFFFFRRITGFLAPLSSIPVIILALLGEGGSQTAYVFWVLFFSLAGSWLLLLILEIVFSFIGASILRAGEEE